MTTKTVRLLCINPGSTSTKIAVFEDETELFTENLSHSNEELAPFASINDQYEFRAEVVRRTLAARSFDPASLSAVVGRGGLVDPIPGGCYEVNDAMLHDLRHSRMGEHASNLGGMIAHAIAAKLGVPSFIVDPVVVDELHDVARVSGLKEIPRVSIFHALNQKAVARRAARKFNKRYEDLNLIICHMGGGTTVGAHRGGRVVDVNDGINGEGPFTPERTGQVPALPLLKMAFSGKYTHDQLKKMIKGSGGLVSLLGTNSCIEVEKRIEAGDAEAKLVYEAMAYQVAKEIGAMAAVLEGKVDAIILTGGVAHSAFVLDTIERHVKFIAPVYSLPGGDEMAALAGGALPVLRGEAKAKKYKA